MAQLYIFLLLLLSFHCTLPTAKSSPVANPNPTNFIKAECGTTLYPALCVQCLSTYSSTIQQSHKQLAQAAVSVSLSRAQSIASFLSKMAKMRGIKPIEYRAVKDCTDNMASSVDQLSRSVKELGGMRQDFEWHVSNVESWVGAALTFENTCVDGFASPMMDGNVKVAIKSRLLDFAQVTSNALVLVRRFAAKHKVGALSESTSLP